MYRIGYIDDEPTQFDNFAKKLKRWFDDVELILLTNCNTKAEFVEKIYENQIDVLLVDYKMAQSFGYNGTRLISYINDQVRDLECFILTAVDTEQIDDKLVAARNVQSKTIFDTEAGDETKLQKLREFVETLKESADVYKARREQKIEDYEKLLLNKQQGILGADEEEFLSLYKVLSSYGMVEKLPEHLLKSEFDKQLDELLSIGKAIIEEHSKA